MLFKPSQLGSASLSAEELARDKKGCKKYGPCGLGQKAIYLNSFYIDRRYYLPLSSVTRVFKRIAMTKGGFTGKGMFVSMPLLVVEYDGGKEKQCNFKREEDVDLLLAAIERQCPDIRVLSKTAETWKSRREAALLEKQQKEAAVSPEIGEQISALYNASAYLEKKSELYIELSAAAKAKRVYDRSNPAYKWVALTIMLMGAVAFFYGIYSMLHHSGGFGMYFMLFGLAAIFLFAGAHVIPTAKNNRRYIENRLANARKALETYADGYPGFPVPGRYAHPVVLRWMRDSLIEGEAKTIPEAFEVLKKKLRSLNADVSVEQEVYDDVMAIKPMFLVNDYQ
ncbi:MAG: ATPase P [Eubacteriales bacterium]|nr:ATPase P [Eubacteriales bacterium]